jgi:hypothetical protein
MPVTMEGTFWYKITMRQVAIATASTVPNSDEDGAGLIRELSRAGLQTKIAIWDDPAVDWGQFNTVVVRTTWDYAPRRDQFLGWATALGQRVLNSPRLLKWSTDKTYLRVLQGHGVPVIQTLWNPAALPRDGRDWVIKPSIGAAAEDVTRWAPDDAERGDEALAELATRAGAVMVQPYLTSVDTLGESCLVFLGGRFSHAVRKGALLIAGDGPVEPVLAGDPRERITPVMPTDTQLAVAKSALAVAFRSTGVAPIYARVDLVDDDSGAPVVLELELAEPSLYLTHADGAAAQFANVLAAEIRSR